MTRRGFTHETPAAETDEWYTPPEVFDRLGLSFDLDPCSPMSGPVEWVPARRFLSARDNGLTSRWEGRVWLNPPYGPLAGRFLHRLAEHGNGVALIFARTETAWFQGTAPRAGLVTFVRGRLAFVRADRGDTGHAGAGSVILAWGTECIEALARADFGWSVTPHCEVAAKREVLGLAG